MAGKDERARRAEQSLVRLRLLSLALLAASVSWLGASSILPTPRVVVFPLTVNGEAQQDAGDRLAVLFAQQMSENGIHVVAPVPGTPRTDFLTAARKLSCDYYVTGFITPLGAQVTVVEQVVSTTSGTVVASNSAELLTYADASGQGAILASLVKRHADRAFASLDDKSAAQETPEPKETSGIDATLAKLGSIFKRKPRAVPSPSPSPADVPTP